MPRTAERSKRPLVDAETADTVTIYGVVVHRDDPKDQYGYAVASRGRVTVAYHFGSGSIHISHLGPAPWHARLPIVIPVVGTVAGVVTGIVRMFA